jgi:hypothetical protein
LKYVPAGSYTDERLGRLLRLLRPAPQAWVARAKRILAERRTGDSLGAGGASLTDADITWLSRELERDADFRRLFDADPVAAAEAAGRHDLARGLDRELRELADLAERIATDEAFRFELDTDPVEALAGARMPEATIEQLVHALALPDDIVEKLPEVVAHAHERLSPRERALIVLLGRPAVAQRLRDIAARND